MASSELTNTAIARSVTPPGSARLRLAPGIAGLRPALLRRCLLPLLLLPIALAVACDSQPGPTVTDAEGRDLGRDAFLPDSTDDADDVSADAVDLSDADLTDDVENGVGKPCVLLDATSCPATLKCVPRADGTGECRPLSAPAVALGEPCGRRGYDDCEAGALCVSPDEETGLRCFASCDAATGQGCDGTATCSEPLPLLVEPVGICL